MSEEINEICKMDEKPGSLCYAYYLKAYAIVKSGGVIDDTIFKTKFSEFFDQKIYYAIAMGVKDAKNTQHTSTYIASKKQVLRFIEEALSDHEM